MAGYGRSRAFSRRRGDRLSGLYPSLGIVWEGELDDPILADALCRAYNRYALDLVAGHRTRLFPAAHISVRDSALACAELRRVAKLGAAQRSSQRRL